MRRAAQFAVFGLILLAVRSCGVNETYDRLKYSADSVGEKVGVRTAGRAWNEKIYPSVVGAATRTVREGSAATLSGGERVTATNRDGFREKLRKAGASLKQAFFDLIGGSVTPPAESEQRAPNGAAGGEPGTEQPTPAR
jgi:hypothetical protein